MHRLSLQLSGLFHSDLHAHVVYNYSPPLLTLKGSLSYQMLDMYGMYPTTRVEGATFRGSPRTNHLCLIRLTSAVSVPSTYVHVPRCAECIVSVSGGD